MKRILCYGDSNTWGYDPDSGLRYDEKTRYTKVLAALLGQNYEVIEEGLPGRTSAYDTDVDAFVNGRTYLYPCLSSHTPLDLIIIMLGSNDLSTGGKVNAYYAAAGVERLVNLIRHWSIDQKTACPKILIVSPPLLCDHPVQHEWQEFMTYVFDFPRCQQESKHFRRHYQDVANTRDCGFLAAEDYTKTGSDGVHLTRESHANLAKALHEKVKAMIG